MTKQWHVHSVTLARETPEAAERKGEVLTDMMREEYDLEWHFSGSGGKKCHVLIKTCFHDDASLRLIIYSVKFVCMKMCTDIYLYRPPSQSKKSGQVQASL